MTVIQNIQRTLKLDKEKKNNSIKKQAKDLNKHLTKEDIQGRLGGSVG